MAENGRSWLKGHLAGNKRNSELDSLMPMASQRTLLANSFMALLPGLAMINDSELDPKRLIALSEGGHGLLAVESTVNAHHSFVSFKPEELRAAFSMESLQTNRPQANSLHKRRRRESADSDVQPGANRSIDIVGSKRGRYLDGHGGLSRSRDNSPVPFTVGSTTETQSPSATPAKAPGILISSTSVGSPAPPPLPPGPPPPRKPSITGPADLERVTLQHSVAEEEDEENDIDGAIIDDSRHVCMPAQLKKECLKVLKHLVEIEDWPRSVRRHIQLFQEAGYVSGNPFAVNCSVTGPSLIEAADQDMSLELITGRVRKEIHYQYFHQFEDDVRDLVLKALERYESEGAMRVIAQHFAKVAERELKASSDSLNSLV